MTSSILRKTLCHASRSKKPQNQTQRADFPKKGNLQKPKPFSFMLILLALLAMLCYGTPAWAQTEWNGTATDGPYTISNSMSISNNLTIHKGETLTLNITGNNITFEFPTITLDNGDNTTPGANLNLNVTGNNVKLKFNLIKTNHADSKTKAGTVTLNNSGSNFIVNKRDKSNSTNNLFYIAKNWSLEVIGTEANPVTFDGEWTMAENGIPTDNNQIANWKAYGVYYSHTGDITFRNVKVKNFVSNAVASKGEGGVFRYSGYNDMIMTTELTNVEIYQCYAGLADINFNPPNVNNSYGRIIGIFNGILVANCNNLKIHHCFVHEPDECEPTISGMGGVIRSQGSVGGTFTIENSSFHHNTYMNRKTQTPKLTGQGGVINWRSGVNDLEHEGKLVIKDCKFYNNKAKHGGAISTNGRMHLERVEIYNNEAVCGGGVFFWTYNGRQSSYDGEGFNAVFGTGVEIHDNTATEYGGGAYLTIDASNDVGFDANNQPISPSFQVQINTGSQIYHNKAPKGAGIAIMDACPYSHYYSDISKWSLEYQRTVTLNGGKIYNNYAQDTEGDEMAGAGIYIEKYEYYEGHLLSGFHTDYTNNPDSLAQNNSGFLNVNLLSGEIYGNSAVNDAIPGYGGGVYIASVFTADSIVSNLNVTIGADTIAEPIKIYDNEAYTDGGGIYVFYDLMDGRKNEGTVTVKGGTIGKIDTTNPQNPVLCPNKALTGNGGGICVMGGLVSVASGSIEYNTAAQDGGGVYVNVPNELSITNIFNNTSISQNVAGRNGGGACVDKGTLHIHSGQNEEDPDYFYFGEDFNDLYGLEEAENETEHTRITKNKAMAGKGGGVYLGKGDLTLGHTLLYDNEAEIDGGGGYVESGYILSYDSKILQNTAGQSGGGMSCFLGGFDMYAGDISYNKAINGDGGGCCVIEAGSMQLWPDIYYWNKNTVVSYNMAGANGGGLCNNAGLLYLYLAEVHNNEAGHLYHTDNTLGGNGGGLFCNTDYYGFFDIHLFDSSIDDNKAYGNSNDADNPTGCGGGIYVQEGTVYSEHSFLRGNTAQMNGGGISCLSGNLNFYATIIGEDGRPNTATNGKGGGIHTHQGNIVIGPCTTYFTDYGDMTSFIEHNTAKFDGGGICNQRGDITIHGGRINQNTAQTGKGGGVFITDGNITMNGGQINNNHADDPAGGYGGGVYSGGGVFHIMERQPNPIIEITKIEDAYNPGDYNFVYILTHQGRAINEGFELNHGISYSTDPTFSTDSIGVDFELNVNGYYVDYEDKATIVSSLDPDKTYYVKAWAWYVDGDGNRYYGESSVVEWYTTSSKAMGKGVSRPRSIHPSVEKMYTYSKAKGKASNRPRSIHPSVEENPFFMELTPLQQAIMAHTPEGDSTTRSSRKGRPTGNEPVDIPEINNNTATYGGGVYVDEEDAELIFSGGEIKANFASEDGGGIYITQNASMQMKRHCQVVENHVPAGKDGGGIYLGGTLLVGDKKEDDSTYHSLKVELNWAGNGVYTEAERNNVFLPLAPILDGDALHKKRVITLLSDISGKINGVFNTKIGISVDRGFREVIYSENDEHEGGAVSTKQWLEKLMPESGNVLNSSLFDDKQTYYALHVTPTDNLFDEDYIYFWSCWTTIVNSDPNNDGTGTTHYTKSGTGANEVWHINTREGLAWFSSLINGLNGVTANPAAKAFVENDLDMSAHLWVPLGSVSKAEGTGTDIIFTDGGQYSGEFDGQGNIISGLICTYMTGIFKYGLFGTLAEGAKVKNTFVDNYMFTTYKQKNPAVPGSYITNPAYKMGGIAAEMANGTAVISNCEARGQMKAVICDAEHTYVGGIAGDVQQGAIHSCMAMPTITGTAQYMGGLAGNLAAATTLKNSYANVLFSTTPTPTYKVGGIAGVNSGLIENVYVRYNNATNTPDLSNDLFYWIVGTNSDQNNIKYCFTPFNNTGQGKWFYTQPTAASLRRTYQPTHLVSGKYGFAHQDQDAETYGGDATTYIANGPIDNDGNLKGLLASLNNWVADNSGYTPWTRTMTSTINDDYPVLEIADFNVVGTEDGVYMKYDYDVNDMWAENGKNFKALTAADNPKAAMYLYKTNGVTATNSTPVAINVTGNTAVRLHIHENVGVTQTDGAELHARVGVTFDNSNKSLALGGKAYDWHMFSSALQAAPMGLTYNSVGVAPNSTGVYQIKANYNSLQGATGITHEDYTNREYMDPPVTTWNTDAGTIGYFPTNTPYGTWGSSHSPNSVENSDPVFNQGSFDFYCFHEESRHWINFKREGTENFKDHWHQDIDATDTHRNIPYINEETMQVGKGYMMGVSAVSMLMADGVLNNGAKTTGE